MYRICDEGGDFIHKEQKESRKGKEKKGTEENKEQNERKWLAIEAREV